MVDFCTRFEWCELQQFSFHSSSKRNMRHCGLLPVTDLIYINVVRQCVIKAGDSGILWRYVRFMRRISLCLTLFVLLFFVCVHACKLMQMLCTCAYTQYKQRMSLLSGVDRSLLSWLQPFFLLHKSLKIYSCESGYPILLRTLGAQWKRHWRSDDSLPTSQSLAAPETSTSDYAEIDRSFLPSFSPSLFLFLYLFDIWLAGRDRGKPPFRVGHFGLWLV